jgi:hypothetical protein
MLISSALVDPVERRLGGMLRVAPGIRRRQVLAVTPGAAGAVLVMPPSARDADHGLYSRVIFLRGSSQPRVSDLLG